MFQKGMSSGNLPVAASGIAGEQRMPDIGKTEARYRVTEHVLACIRNGDYAVGQRLPSARRLSEELLVDRRTVQGALRRLQAEGYLHQRRGGRFEVQAPAPRSRATQDTVYMALSPGFKGSDGKKTLGGWSHYVEIGVREIEQNTELHTRIVDVDALTISGVESLASENPAGFVYGPTLYEPSQLYKLLRPLHARNIPVVVCGDAPELSPFDRVDSDHETGGYLLAQHLIARGCRRFSVCRNEDARAFPCWLVARCRGVERALQEAGLAPLPFIHIARMETSRKGRERFDAQIRLAAGFLFERLRQGVDAILCDSDGHTVWIAEACRLLGYEPGKDVLVAGYDNYVEEIYDRHYSECLPQVTVDKHNQLLGRSMAELLLKRIHGELPAEPQRVLVEPEVIVLAGS